MIADARTIPNGSVIEADLCIIGAGAAGITIAREFANQRCQVVLVESGGLEYDDRTQALYEGENVGLEYSLQWSRLRYFGGSTNHWGGNCRPFDPIDFEERHWIPNSGWPFGYDELQPYYERANETCQLGAFAYDFETLQRRPYSRELPGLDSLVAKSFRYSTTVFGREYRAQIAGSANIEALLFANVIKLIPDSFGRRVSFVRGKTLSGKSFTVGSRYFILAAGGLENPRLLLISDDLNGVGIGNEFHLVGRYFMDHVCFNSGLLVLRRNSILEAIHNTVASLDYHGVPFSHSMSLPDDVQRKDELCNYGAWLHKVDPATLFEGKKPMKSFIDYLEDMGFVTFFRLTNYQETIPDPNSRVGLSRKRDALGMNQIELQWVVGSTNKDNSRRIQRKIASEVSRAGIGRFRSELDDDGGVKWPGSCYHHMGTTRMNRDPRKGVVDADCRVHGISNLFVAGSSVFPTSGFVNPTLTIVALAHRLSDHVKRLLT